MTKTLPIALLLLGIGLMGSTLLSGKKADRRLRGGGEADKVTLVGGCSAHYPTCLKAGDACFYCNEPGADAIGVMGMGWDLDLFDCGKEKENICLGHASCDRVGSSDTGFLCPFSVNKPTKQ